MNLEERKANLLVNRKCDQCQGERHDGHGTANASDQTENVLVLGIQLKERGNGY